MLVKLPSIDIAIPYKAQNWEVQQLVHCSALGLNGQ